MFLFDKFYIEKTAVIFGAPPIYLNDTALQTRRLLSFFRSAAAFPEKLKVNTDGKKLRA